MVAYVFWENSNYWIILSIWLIIILWVYTAYVSKLRGRSLYYWLLPLIGLIAISVLPKKWEKFAKSHMTEGILENAWLIYFLLVLLWVSIVWSISLDNMKNCFYVLLAFLWIYTSIIAYMKDKNILLWLLPIVWILLVQRKK